MSAEQRPAGEPARDGWHMPPPIFFATGFGAGYTLHRWHPWPLLPPDWAGAGFVAGWTLILAAGFLSGWAILTFVRHHTPVLPNRVPRQLVVNGPFRFSRNPMYVGMSLLYLGIAVRLGMAWPLALLPVVWICLWWWIMRHEEDLLRRAYGPAYDEYCRRVRRWL